MTCCRRKSTPLTVSFLWIFFWCVFYLRLWFYVFWNGFYTRKVIFIQLQEFPTPPYCRCCSVTKRSDSGIAEALKAFWDPSQWDKMCFEYHRVIFHWTKWVNIFTTKTRAWKMHFWDPSQWDKMCFECQRIKFQWKKDQHFHICWRSGPRGPTRKISVFLRLAQ